MVSSGLVVCDLCALPCAVSSLPVGSLFLSVVVVRRSEADGALRKQIK